MKNLKLTELEKMNEKEMGKITGGKGGHPWIGITFKPGGPCTCAANCNSAGLRHETGYSVMHAMRTK